LTTGITIVGLGPGGKESLPSANLDILKEAEYLYLRTEVHPVVDWLKQQQVSYQSFDQYYEQADSFDEVYKLIARDVLTVAQVGPVVYAVPGHPLVAETAVEIILREAGELDILCNVVPAMSFLDAIYAALKIDPVQGFQVIDGLKIYALNLNPRLGAVVVQVYSRLVAADIKIALLERYPAEHRVVLVRAAGVAGEERIEYIPLYQMDRINWVDHLTSMYLPPVKGELLKNSALYPMDELVEIMDRLRGEGGCPWDRQQDHHTLTPYLLEETYEVIEAIQQENMYKICEELGDLLLQIVFHAQIARERGFFDINDVVEGICSKMVRRHPHVFGDLTVKNSAEVLINWEKIKKSEKDGDAGGNESIFGETPRGLPALIRSCKIQAKASRVGFDWPDYKGALAKVREELAEWEEALAIGDRKDIEQETGDIIFAAVNVARLAGIDPEVALTATIEKFIRRFQYIANSASLSQTNLTDMSLEQMDFLWEKAKKDEKKQNI